MNTPDNIPAILPTSASFDYDGIPSVAATTLRSQAVRIRKLVKTTMATVIEAGKELISVKQSLRHGKFGEWVEVECGFSLGTAENYIRAARFAEGKIATVTNMSPATVYRLAAKSTPPDIVKSVIERCVKGEVVSDRQVLDALNEVRRRRREDDRKASLEKHNPSKRTKAKWEKRRSAEQHMQNMHAQQQREVIGDLIDAIGLNNARLVVDALQGFYEKFDELKKQVAEAVTGT
jgi:hypothetical protein